MLLVVVWLVVQYDLNLVKSSHSFLSFDLVGVEKNGSKIVQASMKRTASAALENADSAVGDVVVKRPKKKTNVWSKSTTRKTSRKSKPVKISSGEKKEESIEVNPAQRYSLEERNGIQLSKVRFLHFNFLYSFQNIPPKPGMVSAFVF